MAPALAGDLDPHGTGHVFVGAPEPHPGLSLRPRAGAHGDRHPARRHPQARESIAGYVREHYAAHVPHAAPFARRWSRRSIAGPSPAAQAMRSRPRPAVPGAALVGDAGGCSHPLTATGMTTALHDITTLVEWLEGWPGHDQALVAYQRQRYRFVRAREVFAHSLYDVLRGAGPGARAMRTASSATGATRSGLAGCRCRFSRATTNSETPTFLASDMRGYGGHLGLADRPGRVSRRCGP